MHAADYTLWNMEWNMERNIGYQTSVMSQELHFYHKAVANCLGLVSLASQSVYKVGICLGT